MIEKLNMTEEQVEMLTEIRNGQRQKQRELQKTNREAFDAVMKKANPDFAGFGGRGNRGNRGNGGTVATAAMAGTMAAGTVERRRSGQNGNQGNRPQFDPAALQKMREDFQKMMDNPEVKAQREKQQAADKAVEDESYAIVMKNLYPRQRATLKKMVGAPFDRSVMGGMFGRPPGAATAKNGAAAGKTAVAKTGSEDDDEEAAAPARCEDSGPSQSQGLPARRGRRAFASFGAVPTTNELSMALAVTATIDDLSNHCGPPSVEFRGGPFLFLKCDDAIRLGV